MDLAFFKHKKLILIPTIGQTEQIYLANRLARKNQCVLQHQTNLNLQHALKNILTIDFFELKNAENAENSLDLLFDWLE